MCLSIHWLLLCCWHWNPNLDLFLRLLLPPQCSLVPDVFIITSFAFRPGSNPCPCSWAPGRPIKPHLLLLWTCCVFGLHGGLAPPTLNVAIFRSFLILCTKLSSEIACHFLQDLNGCVFMISFIGSKARGLAGIKTARESGMPEWVRITVTTDKTEAHSGISHNGWSSHSLGEASGRKGTYKGPWWHFLIYCHSTPFNPPSISN